MPRFTSIGFTGTREGMTRKQSARVESLLEALAAPEGAEFHFGDCVGADAAAFLYADALGLRTVSHPPEKGALRAFCQASEIRDPRPYLVRNRAIVAEADVLVAAPHQFGQNRGTGSTMRMADSAGVPVYTVMWDGLVRSPIKPGFKTRRCPGCKKNRKISHFVAGVDICSNCRI